MFFGNQSVFPLFFRGFSVESAVNSKNPPYFSYFYGAIMDYTVEFSSTATVQGHTEYTLAIHCISTGVRWEIRKRYSEMRSFHQNMRKITKNLPVFPPKKVFGRLNPAFIRKRQTDLAEYFRKLGNIAIFGNTQSYREFFGGRFGFTVEKQPKIVQFDCEKSRSSSQDEEIEYADSLRQVISAF